MAVRKLDIGCGNTITEGEWDRADIDPNCPDLDMVCDMTAIPVPDETYDVVRSSHNIEHVPIETAERALAEWFRILKPGGVATIDTPNIDRNIDLYKSGEWPRDFATLTPAEQERCSHWGEPHPLKWLLFKIFSTETQWNVHYANYNSELLSKMCIDAGFTSVKTVQTEPSLIIEARK